MANLFLTPHQIISGTESLEKSMTIIQNLGKKALIVTDPMMIKLGNIAKLTKLLTTAKVEYNIFSDITGEPTSLMVQNGVDVYLQNHCDFLIALGGGSPIDSMKAIAMMKDEKQSISSFMGVSIEKELPPMVAIPTTAGTGSEATMFTIITDIESNIKMLLKGTSLIPAIAVIDPMFSMTAPKSVTSSTGIDALCHAIESYTSKKAQPLSNTFALSAIKRIFENILIVYNDPTNEKSRIQMSLAALEAGISFNNSSVTIIHGMSRPIGALFHIPHGLSNAMLLEECMRYVAPAVQDRFANIARYCHLTESTNDEIATLDFLKSLSTLLKQLEIPGMKKAGIEENTFYASIDKMSDDALSSGSPSNTIMEINKKDILYLYNTIYQKTKFD